jgi:hypothetical protein
MKAKALWAAALAVAACALASAGGVAASGGGSAAPIASLVGVHSTLAPSAPLNPTSWIPAAVYPTTIARYAYAQVGSDMYVIGGVSNGTRQTTMNRYDASTNIWTPRAAVPVASEAPSAAYYNGKIYLAEGDTGSSLRIYDIASNTWSSGAARPVSSGYGAAAGAFNGKVYVVGGGAAASATTTVYDIASNTWTTGTSAPAAFLLAGYHQDGQYLYVVGGFSSSTTNVTATQRLDMSNGTWTSGPAFTPQRGDFALAMSGTKLYALGGDANAGSGFFDSVATVNELDTSAWPGGSWTTSPNDLPTARQASEAGFFSTARAGGEIWSTGGLQGASFTFLPDHLYRSQCPASGVSRISENFDGVAVPALPNCWTAANAAGGAPLWVTSNAGNPPPASDSAPNAAFVDDPSTATDKRLDSPVIALRAGVPTQLTFRQNYNLEFNTGTGSTQAYDGGVLEISVDGGAFQDILTAGGSFAAGGYNKVVSTSFGSTIPGRNAWSGNSGGFVTTTVNLPATALGHNVQFRWRMGSDSSVSSAGWRIDSVSLDARPVLTVANAGSGSGSVSSNPAGISCGATCASRFDNGSSVTLTASPAVGTSFTGWSGAGCSGTGTCTVTMDADKSVTANFAIQSFALTVTKAGTGVGTITSSPAGINCPTTCSASYVYNTAVTLTAAPSGKSRFGGWTGDCAGTGACVVSMTATRAVTATFLPPLAPPACKVPKVIGKSLAKAKTAIKKAHCKVGKISHKASSKKKKGKVIGQTPKAGKKLKNGAKVNVTVGKGPAKKKK